ncbi:hypothetical protein DHEL01_v203346 [Diaporthe helianthi]|uniref:Pal1 cell morphology protein n=1 Tax=Diaporthe helianthi TaxID=158607 RepID=A0A2P5I6X0_DIAHE|nr:hypothetical protein DHEL01_v203346 [Diaporthe helianthi]
MSLLEAPPSYDGSPRRTKSDRAQRRPKPRKYVADTIDRLDTSPFGGPYHHGGPYDATMKSFNLNSKFSPVAARSGAPHWTQVPAGYASADKRNKSRENEVKWTMPSKKQNIHSTWWSIILTNISFHEGNKAAWKATPREAKLDALLRGRPLDGTASVPPGERALNGELMDYEYSTDMLRDPHAGGGPYKQWPGVDYHPDDLKGKGEPGFTMDRERRAKEGIRRSQSVRERRGEYELLPQRLRGGSDMSKESVQHAAILVRQRSSSAAASSSRPRDFVDGLKRRVGSLRRR